MIDRPNHISIDMYMEISDHGMCFESRLCDTHVYVYLVVLFLSDIREIVSLNEFLCCRM